MSQPYNLPSLYNDNGDDFIIIAHRGASAYYPENTMVAFRAAPELDAEMIELDVMLSRDGVPVIFHDRRLNRHSNGKGLLSNYTLEELKKLDAGSWFDLRFSDQRIPTLEEVLTFASGKIALNIEIKAGAVTNEVEGGVEEKCLELVEKYEMKNHVLFSSFDYRAVSHIKQLDSKLPAAVIYNNLQSNNQLPHRLTHKYKADAFNCSYRQLTRRWIRNLREHNIPNFIYTVDREAKMRKLITAGVNGIFTNKPDLLARVVREYKK